MDIVAETIAHRIRKEFPEGFALIVDNTKLIRLSTELVVKAYFADAKADNAFSYVGAVAGGGDTEGAGTHQSPVTLTPSTKHVLAATSKLVAAQTYRELVDWDEHLDDVQKDYLNEDLGAFRGHCSVRAACMPVNDVTWVGLISQCNARTRSLSLSLSHTRTHTRTIHTQKFMPLHDRHENRHRHSGSRRGRMSNCQNILFYWSAQSMCRRSDGRTV